MSKAATIRSTRRLADGRILVQVVCPRCDGRHWLPEADGGDCPRRPGAFTINPPTRKVSR